jgi:hypothetical protein
MEAIAQQFDRPVLQLMPRHVIRTKKRRLSVRKGSWKNGKKSSAG